MFSRFLTKQKTNAPEFEERRMLLNEEEIFFGRLRRALPNCYIFPKIDLEMILAPSQKDPKLRNQSKLKLRNLKVDYGIFDGTLTLLCVVELTGRDQENEKEKEQLIAEWLKQANIKSIRWTFQPLPTAEQILRTLAPYSSLASPKPDISTNAVIRNAYEEPQSSRGMNTIQAIHQADPHPSNIMGLSAAALDRLTPKKHIQTLYPHVWQRINLFSAEPKHLKKYLESLFLQDRGVERAGFPAEVIAEITEIQSENERFLQISMPKSATWETQFLSR
ncbi:MAG: DUF2726 domain-containing protein [Burkholderiaceae bacterium]|nr:DUF2726 domain-containing protein [Burkholderiaceae bacterium]